MNPDSVRTWNDPTVDPVTMNPRHWANPATAQFALDQLARLGGSAQAVQVAPSSGPWGWEPQIDIISPHNKGTAVAMDGTMLGGQNAAIVLRRHGPR